MQRNQQPVTPRTPLEAKAMLWAAARRFRDSNAAGPHGPRGRARSKHRRAEARRQARRMASLDR